MAQDYGTFNRSSYETFFSEIPTELLWDQVTQARIQKNKLMMLLTQREMATRKDRQGNDRGLNNRADLWTVEELDILEEFTINLTLTVEDMEERLPGRTEKAIRAKMSKMGLSRVDAIMNELEERLNES